MYHDGVIAAVDAADVEAFDVSDFVRREVTGERDGQIVAQSQQLTTLHRARSECAYATQCSQSARCSHLIRQFINEFAVFTVLVRERLFQFKHRRVDLHSAVTVEHLTTARARRDT